MVTANESHTYQQLSARNSSCLDNMAFPLLERNYSLPYFPLPKHTTEVAFPGQSAPNLPDLNIGQQDTVGGILNPIGTPYLKDWQYALSRGVDKPFDGPQKRFLIFDQSGNDTRLFFGPAFSHQDRISTPNGLPKEVDHPLSMKPIVEEKWDENHVSDGEGEMLEDTDEIDALLYSDTDYDSDYDEVTSTMHSPFRVEEGYNKDKLLEDEPLEQVASSDGSPKRQRLLDGKYKKSSLENDVESCCAGYDDTKRANKVKIRQALKILEAIVPGLDNNDPLSIIDQAVAYLKSMKTEAEELELSYTGCNSEESLEQ